MAAVGGSAEAININGRDFQYAADVDVTIKFGGFESEVQSNGNGTSRIIKTRVPPSATGNVVECDHDRGDQEFLQEVSDSNEFATVAITLASGIVIQGSATITGELGSSTQNATCAFDVMGQGKFTQQ